MYTINQNLSTEELISRMTDVFVGGKRWTKNGMDRIYFNASAFGLECDYYKTGNVCTAFYNGERISNCKARKLMAEKTYIDLRDWSAHSTSEEFKNALVELMLTRGVIKKEA